MADLNEIRKKIDEIDNQLLKLFIERMDCSRQVAEYKTENGLPVLNPKREQEILDEVAEKSGNLANSSTLLYSTIMNISRAAQYPIVTKNSPLNDFFEKAKNKSFDPQKIGYQGTQGSYSNSAAKFLFSDKQLYAYEHFEDVFRAVVSGEIDAGVVPIENSYAGSIAENSDLLLKYDLKINKMLDLPVSHCLLAKENADLSTIKTVYSHIQALDQCRDFLNEHSLTSKAMDNTAFAAKFIAENGDETMAAIASKETAEIYNLKTICSNIQSSNENFTRFMVFSKEMSVEDDADIVSIAFSLLHTSGSLYKTLSMLASNGLNMTAIHSRPDKESPFRYVFYVDFEGNINDEKTASLLCGLNDELPMLKIFGNCKILKK